VIKRKMIEKGKANMCDKKRVMRRKNTNIKDIKSVNYIDKY
jgi:hypothetical protein